MAIGRRRQGRQREQPHELAAHGRRRAASAPCRAVNADSYDPEGRIIPQVYQALTRRERHEELIHYGIEGAVAQVERAYEIANGRGAININVLWEMGGAQPILHGVLERTRGKVAGVTCGAGMPYKLSEIAASYGVFYLPIISSGRAFRALWKRAYSKVPQWLGAVVYEDPWLAGGHNGLSNAEDPRAPQDPYPRVAELRAVMREGGIPDTVPIVMAGGVWRLDEWDNWIDNPELGSIMFQFGTRPLLTQESPIPVGWKERLMTLEEGDILLHKFSPTGFYSSAVRDAVPAQPRSAQRAPDRLHQGRGRRPCLPARRRDRHAQELLGHQGRSAACPRMVWRRASPRR